METKNNLPLSYYMRQGRTKEEQIELNKPALEWVRHRLKEDEEVTPEEAQLLHEEWELVKEIIDSQRTQRKLFK